MNGLGECAIKVLIMQYVIIEMKRRANIAVMDDL